ncbi:unnamed protein product [Linum trigynum]|uniref:Uncharacterized protein n=1 Tax=Linum trigynum TaxID=586398 RepID=A0AAV2CJL8_9ROSI
MCLNILNSITTRDHKDDITGLPYATLVTKFLKKVGVDLDAYKSSADLSVYHPIGAIINDLQDPVRAVEQRRMVENGDQEYMDGARDMGADEANEDDDGDGDEGDDLVDDADSRFRPRQQVQ